ncbi:MAG: electron transfer flavoprotein subunit beta/FixA family protein [Bacteroidota bacterium]
MNFCVCIKQVPDVSAPMHVQGGDLVVDAGRVVLNAYDASAVEGALTFVEEYGGTIDVLLVGPERAAETVRKALAMGADRGLHLVVPEDADLDSAAVSQILADYLRDKAYDVIAAGKQAQDTDAGLTGSMLAERLGLAYVTNAVVLAADSDTFVVTRQGDTAQEVIAFPTPCVVTISNNMNDPRIPNLRGVMAAKKKPIETVAVEDVPTASVRTVSYEPLPTREPGEIVEGTPPTQAATLVRHLQEASVL